MFRAIATAVVLACPAAFALEPANDGERLMAEFGLRESAKPVSQHAGWRVPKRIVIDGGVPGLLEALRTAAPGVEFVSALLPSEIAVAARGADAAIGRPAFVCNAGLLAAGTKLRWLQSVYAGVEACTDATKSIAGRNILLTNLRAVAAPVIAEHAIAMMLSLTRGMYSWIPRQAQKEWDESTRGVPMTTVAGKTLLVAGLGGIGSEVAKRGHGLGMRVIATRASRQERPVYVEYVGTAAELSELVGRADVIINALPLTHETQAIFDAAMFARMKRSAYFINVGRGQTVVTAALTEALLKKVIAGAGIDVVDPEPLPKDHPLWEIPNIVVTPHIAATSEQNEQAQVRVLRENLRRYIAGEKLLSVVDITRGY